MRITLLRHGETEGNLLGQYIGRTDSPLCAQGEARANGMGVKTEVDRVYTSGLQRTVQTARILFPRAEIVPCAGLNEMDFGDFEGKSWRDLAGDERYQVWVDGGCEEACPGGEDKGSLTARCMTTFLSIAAHEHAQGAAEVYLVAHGGTIMAILSQLARPIGDYFSWKAGFCGRYLLEYAPEEDRDRPLRLLGSIPQKRESEQS